MRFHFHFCLATLLGPAIGGKEDTFRRISVPEDYFVPLTNSSFDPSSLRDLHMCSFGCLQTDACQAFAFAAATGMCNLGSINIPAGKGKLLPEHVYGGKEVFVRKGLLKLKALRVHHLNNLRDIPSRDVPIEQPDMEPLDIPLAAFGHPHSNVLKYKDKLVQCGSSGEKPKDDYLCRSFSFRTGQWTLMGGGAMPRPHLQGFSTILADRLWVFCGRKSRNNDNVFHHVDSFDLIREEWRQEDDADPGMARRAAAIVPIEKTGKILFVGGMFQYRGGYFDAVFLFNPATGIYTELTQYDLGTNGLVQCAMDPSSGGDRVICAGAFTGAGNSERVYFFDVLTEEFAIYDEAFRLPRECFVNFATVDGVLYAATRNNAANTYVNYRFNPVGPVYWEELTNTPTIEVFTEVHLIAYSMDYTELLV